MILNLKIVRVNSDYCGYLRKKVFKNIIVSLKQNYHK